MTGAIGTRRQPFAIRQHTLEQLGIHGIDTVSAQLGDGKIPRDPDGESEESVRPPVGLESRRHLPHPYQGFLQHCLDIDATGERTQTVAEPALGNRQPAGEGPRVTGANADEEDVFARELSRIRHRALES